MSIPELPDTPIAEILTAAEALAALKRGGRTCEEASMLSKETFIPCGGPATAYIKTRDVRPYFMCFGCADHNVKHRGATILAVIARPEAAARAVTSPDDAQLAEASLSNLLNQYAVMRAAKDEAERALDEIDEKLAPLKKAVIDAMIAAEFQRVSHLGRLYYLSVPGRPSVLPEKKPDFIQWLKENGEEGIITPDYINSNTLWGWWNRLDDDLKPVVEPMLKISEEIELKSPADYARKRKKR